MDTNGSILKEVLAWVASSAGAMTLCYFAMERIPFLANLTSEAKRYVSLAIAAVLAMAAFCASIGLGYVPTPATAQAWLEALFSIAFVAVGGSQVIHGRLKLRQK